MAWLERISWHITNAGQEVAAQTKNFTEVTRLNGIISDKERRIQHLYTAIGQKYYQLHQAEESAELSQEMRSITLLLSEIKQHQAAIQQIKGVAICPSCGAEIPANAQFCSSCGTNIQKPNAFSGKTCPECGHNMEETGAFCTFCGAKLDAAPSSQVLTDISEQSVSAVPQHICPNCHAVLEPDNVFCSECGTPCDAELDTAPLAQIPIDVPDQSVAAAPRRSCPRCHTSLAVDDIFCPECGAALENT